LNPDRKQRGATDLHQSFAIALLAAIVGSGIMGERWLRFKSNGATAHLTVYLTSVREIGPTQTGNSDQQHWDEGTGSCGLKKRLNGSSAFLRESKTSPPSK